MRKTIRKIIDTVSGDRAFYSVREISNFHRIQASTGYRAAAQHVTGKLKSAGINAVIRSYPADGKTWFLTNKMFKEWDCKSAELHLVEPQKRLADFFTNNTSVMQKSYPADFRKAPLEIVHMDKGSAEENYPDLDLKGKLIFIHQPYVEFMDWAVKDRGAVGIISDYLREIPGVRTRADLYDILNYTSFWWKHAKDDAKIFGFVLTPRAGDELAKLCDAAAEAHAADPSKPKYLKATGYVDAKIYDGAIEVVDAVIEGESEEEILITSHLCHPRSSANDNASGVGASMEAFKALKDLIDAGELPKPKRSLRMIFVPEFTGTYAWLADVGDKVKRIKAGINMDMVGGRQGSGYGPLTLTGVPLSTPTFIMDLAALVLDEVRNEGNSLTKGESVPLFNSTILPFSGGSDHMILSDPTIGVPTPMLGQWPDIYYHTSGDTMEVIDPNILHKSASICAAYGYTLANLSEADVPLIMNRGREAFVKTLTQLLDEALEGSLSTAEAFERYQAHADYVKASCLTYLDFFPKGAARTRVQKMVDREVKLLDLLARSMWSEYVSAHAPDFAYQASPAPKEYQYVPVRLFKSPLVHLDDYALGNKKLMDAYKGFEKGPQKALKESYTFETLITYYMDGKRTLWEIAKAASRGAGGGDATYADQYVKLLEKLGLAEVKHDPKKKRTAG